MTRVAPATVAYPTVAPSAQGPPGRASRDDFAPVLRSEGRKPDPDTSETSARTAGAEGTTPRADDPGATRPEATEGRRPDGSRDDRPDHGSNGVGREVSDAAHRAQEEGTSVSESVHAALRTARGEGGAAPAGPVADDPIPGSEATPTSTPTQTPAVPVDGPAPAPAVEAVAPTGETVPTQAEAAAEASSADVTPGGSAAAGASAVTTAESPDPSGAPPVAQPAEAPASAEPSAPAGQQASAGQQAPAESSAPAGQQASAGQQAPAEPSAPASQQTTAVAGSQGGTAGSGDDPGADAGPGVADPAPEPRRPGHLPEHGRGGVMRREDPPAVGWNRRQADDLGDGPATAPVGARASGPATPEPPSSTAQPVPVTAAGVAPAPQPTGERLPVTTTEMPLRAGSRLAELADTFRTVVRVAAQEGRTEARITLHPGDLGEVQIRLRYENGGVSADVLADSRQAAQTLQQSVSDLRRTLEAQGMNVLWLDVRHGGQEQPAWLSAKGRAGGDTTQSNDLEDELAGREIPVERLDASGSILDVLA